MDTCSPDLEWDWHAGKTLSEQAETLAHSHVYILIHGAAMALYMFLPRHAAIIEVTPLGLLLSLQDTLTHISCVPGPMTVHSKSGGLLPCTLPMQCYILCDQCLCPVQVCLA